ncbi:MAG: ribosome silencing factor [bacterium]|nr:ribosome silencing factor [bacterium]
MEAKVKAELVRKALDDKLAEDIEVLDVADRTSLAEYFVIASCQSTTQVRACADEVEDQLKDAGEELLHSEGYRGGAWILLDYGDVVVHVMQEETRDFYDIERLWRDGFSE